MIFEGVLSRRNFQLLFSAQLISALGDGATLVAASFAVLEITGSFSAVGWVLAARYLPLSAILLVGGVFADRASRRKIMIASNAARAMAQAVLAILLLTGRATLWHCLLLQSVYGIAEAFFEPAAAGLVPQIVPAHQLQEANSFGQIASTMSRTVGPAIGGILVVRSGAGGAVAVDAVSFAVAAVLIARISSSPPPERSDRVESVLKDALEGWREVRKRPWIWLSVMNFTLMATLTIPAVLVLGPALSWRGLGGVAGWSALTTAFGVGALVGGLLAMRLQLRRPGLVLMAMLIVAALRPALFVSGARLPWIAAYVFVAGVATATAGVVWATLLQRHLPATVLSRVSAMDDFGTTALTPVGYVIAAPIAAAVGLDQAVLLLAALPVAVALGCLCTPTIRSLAWPARSSSLGLGG